MTTNHTPSFDRRGLLRLGGLTAAGAAVLAACGNTQAGEIGRVGTGATQPTLAEAPVTNSVLTRTSAAYENSIAAAYQRILDGGYAADHADLVKAFLDHHTTAATTFNDLTTQAGDDAWTCGSTRLDAAYINPIFDRVLNGAPATDQAAAIEPSDDVDRDMINLVLALENLSAETSQALVQQVTDPAARGAAMKIGARSARQAALVALRINPKAYVGSSPAAQPAPATTAPADAGPPQTEIPLPVAIPSTFGSLSGITYIGGRGDENGVRLKVIFETPSLNSLAYPFDTCATA